jgi:hypothetical protein
MAVVPPWAFYEQVDGEWRPLSIEYGSIVAPPVPAAEGRVAGAVAWPLLALQWVVVAGLTLGAVLALRERRSRFAGARKRRSAREGDIRRGQAR